MIYISYGVTKSASTFAYQLTEAIIEASGHPVVKLSTKIKGRASPENYIDPIKGDSLRAVRDEIRDQAVVVKTHSGPDKFVLDEISDEKIFASAIIRDPREIALSVIDHGRRSRQSGISDFAEFFSPQQVLDTLRDQLRRFSEWISNEKVLLLTYDEICFDTPRVVSRIAAQIGLHVEEAEIANKFLDKKVIGQFNVGKKDRHEELSREDSDKFIEEFPKFYNEGRFSVEKLRAMP